MEQISPFKTSSDDFLPSDDGSRLIRLDGGGQSGQSLSGSDLQEEFDDFQPEALPTPLISEEVASAIAVEEPKSSAPLIPRIPSSDVYIEDVKIRDKPPLGKDSSLPERSVLSSLDDILLSIDSQSAGTARPSLYDIANICLSRTEIDSMLVGFGVTIPPSSLVLHSAVLQRDLAVIYLIMRSRYRYMVNERDSLGRTPLHIALLNADFISLQILFSMPVGPYPLSEEPETEDVLDLDFPDLSLRFNQLPAFHLPLARAGWDEFVPDILATYSLVFAYFEVTQKSLEGREASYPGLTLLASTCGWSLDEASSSSYEEGPTPLRGPAWALWRLGEFTETREGDGWSVDARDGWNSTALHRASELGVAEIVESILDAGADPLLKDCNGDLPVHRAVDSGDPDTFAVLLRRGGTAFVGPDRLGGDTGCDPWSEDTSMMALFRRCILRGSWRCLGRLVTDEVYSQFPLPEAAMDGLLDFANLCGYTEEFSEAFKMAVDNAEPQEDGPWRKVRMEKSGIYDFKIYTHEICFNHLPLLTDMEKGANKRLKLLSRFPENPSRLHCLTPLKSGILRTRCFDRISWEEDAPPANLADILRVHEWSYIKALLESVEKVSADAQLFKNTKPFFFHEVDADTPVTPGSWEASRRAAGAVIAAVKAVCRGEARQAFCAVRPPGHHVGTWGACQAPAGDSSWQHEEEEDWANGSQGFCLLNNVAIGAAYARYNFSSVGINRIAIVDFDVHHGNGTEQIVLNLKPRERKLSFGAHHHLDLGIKVELRSDFWKLWLDETDVDNIFFVSIHGFGNRFYPGTGGLSERESFPNIRNITVENSITPELFKEEFRTRVIEPLAAFRPDLILLSAGFDAHSHDLVNEGFGVCSEFDYFWMTRHLVAVANDCCDGRIVSVLEGGYNTKAGTLSPLAQSIAYHMKGFLQTPPGLGTCAAKLLDKITCSPSLEVSYSPTEEHDGRLLSLAMSSEEGIRRGVKRRELSSADEGVPKRRRRAAAIRALAHIEERKQKLTTKHNDVEKTEVNVD